MTGRRHLKLVILIAPGILLLSTIGLIACYQAAPTTPVTPVPAGGAAPPPADQSAPSQGQPLPIPQKPLAVQVNLAGFAFSPATVTVPVGTPVIWTNKDSATHTVTSDGSLFDSGNLALGATFSYTFTQAGTFRYHCNLHPSMTGKIVVVEGNVVPTSGTLTPTTGTTTPPTSGTTTTPTSGTTTPPAGGTTSSGGSSGSQEYNY